MDTFLCLACARIVHVTPPWEATIICVCGQDYSLQWEEFWSLTDPRAKGLLLAVKAWPVGEELARQD